MHQFWLLSTERNFGFYAGPIPHSKIQEQARRKGLSGDNLEIFVEAMLALDGVYLEDAEEQRKTNKPPAVKDPEVPGPFRSRKR